MPNPTVMKEHCTGRLYAPAGSDKALGLRTTQAIAMTTAVTTAGTSGA